MRNSKELLEFIGVGRGIPYEDLNGTPRPIGFRVGHSPRCREALWSSAEKIALCSVRKKFPESGLD